MRFTHHELQVMAYNEAKQRGLAQCADKTVMAVLVASSGNVYFGFNFTRTEAAQCHRKGMARGEGYHLCQSECGALAHAEIDALQKMDEQEGKGAHGRMYVYGANHVCDGCQGELAKRPEISWTIGELA